MPYIKDKDKTIFHVDYDQREVDLRFAATTSGELNYCITILIKDYFYRNGGRYQQINDILGALEGAKLEFVRRVVNPYEDVKIQENGDVYEKV